WRRSTTKTICRSSGRSTRRRTRSFSLSRCLAVMSRSARREAPPSSAWWALTLRSLPPFRHRNSGPSRQRWCGTTGPLEAGHSAAGPEEAAMKVIIYGDFNCPYSYLASQRADLLSRAGAGVDWRAVEHNRGLPVTGSRSDSDPAMWDRELAEVDS